MRGTASVTDMKGKEALYGKWLAAFEALEKTSGQLKVTVNGMYQSIMLSNLEWGETFLDHCKSQRCCLIAAIADHSVRHSTCSQRKM